MVYARVYIKGKWKIYENYIVARSHSSCNSSPLWFIPFPRKSWKMRFFRGAKLLENRADRENLYPPA